MRNQVFVLHNCFYQMSEKTNSNLGKRKARFGTEAIESIQNKKVICPGRKPKIGTFVESYIICDCCNRQFSPCNFERHSDGSWHRPFQYIFVIETERNLRYYQNLQHGVPESEEGGDFMFSDVVPQSKV